MAFLQGFKAGKLRRAAAGAGGVNDQQHPATELTQGQGLSIDLFSLEVVDRSHKSCPIKGAGFLHF
jgi:hypothetical protein